MGKKLTALFGICFLLLFSFTNQAEAADQGSIQIYAHVEKDETELIPLQGVTFQLYRIADFKDNDPVLGDEFASLKELPDLSKTDANKKLAQRYDKFVREKQMEGMISTTDENGMAVFKPLSRGIYLLCQKEDFSSDESVYRSESVFLAIPSESINDEIWNLRIEPKFENEKLPIIDENVKEIHDGPKTGDEERIEIWLLVIMLSAGIAVLCLRDKWRR